MVHAREDLVPVLPRQSIERNYWLCLNPDSRELARVRAAIDFVVDRVAAEQDRFLTLPAP